MRPERLHDFTELLPDGVVFIDSDHRITHVNAKLCTLLGYLPGDLRGEPLGVLIPADHRTGHAERVAGFRASGEHHRAMSNRPVLEVLAKDGAKHKVSVSIARLDADGETLLVAFLRELPVELTSAREQADTDALTGAASRLRLSRQLAALGDQHFGLLYLDLNRFKPVNDQYGHAVGDEVLRIVARRLARCVRDADLVVRLGGDEFVVLLPGLQEAQQLETIAGKAHAAVTASISVDNFHGSVGTAIGGVLGVPGMTEESLLEAGDAAMYRAKTAGAAFHLAGAVAA